jgi:pSer/pThr/pTyr-binding forkhead associated (FHA) protein
MSPSIHEAHSLIIEDDKGRFQLPLEAQTYSIGRDPDCDIRLVSQFVSRRHATLVPQTTEDGGYSYRIVDGDVEGRNSANGLLINGRKLRSHDLQHEDEIVFGPKVRAIYVHSQYPCTLHLDDESDEFGTVYAQHPPSQLSSPEDAALSADRPIQIP